MFISITLYVYNQFIYLLYKKKQSTKLNSIDAVIITSYALD